MLVDAFKFFEEGAKPPFPDLKEDSNPVLVKLKLKTGKGDMFDNTKKISSLPPVGYHAL